MSKSQDGASERTGAASPINGGSSVTESGAAQITQAFHPADQSESEQRAARLVEVLEGHMAALKAGKAPSQEALLAAHPDLAGELQACLAGLEFIHGPGDTKAGPPRSLGDFEIVREIGRGGMGAVYEATQRSLGRRVALKILRFGGSDSAAIRRFQREAETVANLHHTNIVPVFAVGSEGGINYFAMQFIEGHSLDRIADEFAGPDGVIPPETVAEWGLCAAEALAHAHARGVIHRDVKPSNLLIDDDNRIWLTDFGLAKRTDDVTLSMTGALLGTPRYMSPEQAAAAHHKVDHRTDIYSLGATLYELATGQPVVTGDSPHNVISQILTTEPTPPRKLRPSLPRDLDTILVKCLSKEPGARYESAAQLAGDLRAFLDGRPITARRVGIVERTTRWVKRQRRSVALTAIAVAATLLVVLAGTLTGYAWHRLHLAELTLKTDHPSLVTQLFHAGSAYGPALTLPTQQPLELPARDYRLQLSGDGRLSQTSGLVLHRGEARKLKVGLEDQTLWSELKIERTFRTVQFDERAEDPEDEAGHNARAFGSRTDIITLDNQGLQCISGRTATPRWSLAIDNSENELIEPDNVYWPWDRVNSTAGRGLGRFDNRPWLSGVEAIAAESDTWEQRSQFDLDQDGMTDVLLTAQHQAWMLAISGRDGSPIWTLARADVAVPGPMHHLRGGGSAFMHPPVPLGDLGGDGVTDFAVTWMEKRTQGDPAVRRVEAFSGRDGKTIWHFDMPRDWFAIAPPAEVPYEMRWFYTASGGGHSASGQTFTGHNEFVVRRPGRLERTGPFEYRPGRLRVLDEGRTLGFTAGKHFVTLNTATGIVEQGSPADLGIHSEREVRLGNFDEDGTPDLLLTEHGPTKTLGGPIPTAVPRTRLTAWSTTRQTIIWQRDIEAELPRQNSFEALPPAWPIVRDLDSDAIDEVIVPDGRSHSEYVPPWGRIAVLEGRSGNTRWRRQLFNADRQLGAFIAGPDIDDDGVRELFVASQWGRDLDLFVDCLSGRDGHSLWRLEQSLVNSVQETGRHLVSSLAWYQNSGDGWPQLIVTAPSVQGETSDRLVVVSAGTGELTHLGINLFGFAKGDLDSDGIDDLVTLQRRDRHLLHYGGTLHSFRGHGGEPWRKLLDYQQPVGDLDGDGIAEMATIDFNGQLTVRAGATGDVAWSAELGASDHSSYRVIPAASHDPVNDLRQQNHDLNGDQVPDLFVIPQRVANRYKLPLVVAFSGRDGRRLWNSEFEFSATEGVDTAYCRDLDGDGSVELIVIAPCDYGQEPLSTSGLWRNDEQLWVAVISTEDGTTRWSEPLSEIQQSNNTRMFELDRIWLETAFGDFNADGIEDLIVPGQRQPGSRQLDWQARDGGNGDVLWQSPIPDAGMQGEAFGEVIPPAVGDLNGDGTPEAIVVAFDVGVGQGTRRPDVVRVTALEGKSGKVLWEWDAPAFHRENRVNQDRNRLKNRLRPLVLRRADGSPWIAVFLWNYAREIYVLNHQGGLVSQLTIEDSYNGFGRRAWTIDATGDGSDAILVSTHTGLSLRRADNLQQSLWSLPKRVSDLESVVGILPGEKAPGRIVVVGGSGDHSLRGLNPATGETDWICTGPSMRGLMLSDESLHLLAAPTAEQPPYVMYRASDQTFVRRGEAVGLPERPWRGVGRVAATLEPTSFDPRLLRSLPWKPRDIELQRMPWVLGWVFFFGFALTALPAIVLTRMIRARRWDLKTMFALVATSAMALTALLANPDYLAFGTLSVKFGIAMATIPIIVALWAVGGWLRSRAWRTLLVWCAIAVCIVVGYIALELLVRARAQNLITQPEERFSWEGWYFVFVPTLYGTCWLLLIGYAIRFAARICLKGFRSITDRVAGSTGT